jgi:hypothetical protein
MTTLSRRDLWKLRVYYAKQVLLGRGWVYWELFVYAMRRSPGVDTSTPGLCGACSAGKHEDCSNWCYCNCEFNRE